MTARFEWCPYRAFAAPSHRVPVKWLTPERFPTSSPCVIRERVSVRDGLPGA
jgi:hypothetical protein